LLVPIKRVTIFTPAKARSIEEKGVEDSEIRVALTTEPIGKNLWQWVVVFASAEEIVRIDRSDTVFPTVAEALAAGQLAISELRRDEPAPRIHRGEDRLSRAAPLAGDRSWRR
jgi:hypothetical protein